MATPVSNNISSSLSSGISVLYTATGDGPLPYTYSGGTQAAQRTQTASAVLNVVDFMTN